MPWILHERVQMRMVYNIDYYGSMHVQLQSTLAYNVTQCEVICGYHRAFHFLN